MLQIKQRGKDECDRIKVAFPNKCRNEAQRKKKKKENNNNKLEIIEDLQDEN